MRTKSFRTWLFSLCLVILLCAMQAVAFAAVQTVEGDGEWIVGDGENMAVAKERAKENAYQNAAERAAVYIESSTEVVNFQLTKHEIRTFAATVLQLKGTPEFAPVVQGKTVEMHCHLVATVDDEDIRTALSKKTELEESIAREQEKDARIAELNRQVKELNLQLQAADTEAQKEKIQQQIKTNENSFTAAQLVSEGRKIYRQTGNYDKAMEYFRQAIELDPQYVPGYMYLAEYYQYQKKDLENSFAVFKKAFTAIPDDQLPYEDYSLRGNFLRDAFWNLTIAQWCRAKTPEEKIAVWERAVALNPMDGSGYTRLAEVCRWSGKADEAPKWQQKALDFCRERLDSNVYPKHARRYYNIMANIYKKRKDYEQAIAAYTGIIVFYDETTFWQRENNPYGKAAGEGNTYINRAECYEKLGLTEEARQDYAKAIEWLNEAIHANQKNAFTYHSRGIAYEKLGQRQEAKRDYAKAFELSPNKKKIAKDKQRSENW